MCMSLPIRFRLIGKNSIVDMNVICFKDNSKNVVLIAFQYIKNKNIFIVNEHRKLKMNPIDDMTLNKVNRIDDME